MVGMNVEEFEQYVIAVCSDSTIVQSVILFGSTPTPTSIRLRVFLIDQSFLDVFYNQMTGKFSFALIEDNHRTFGADNAGDEWHWHPFENPASHVRSETEITFEEFLARVEKLSK
jgi:hypothetical protein